MAHNGGKAQVNVTLPAPYYDFPFLNACKSTLSPWGATTTGSFTSDPRLLLDSRGYPTQMPSGTGTQNWVASQIWIYGQTGDVWVLDWPGTASITIDEFASTSGSLTANVISANRIEYTMTGFIDAGTTADGSLFPSILCRLNISSMAANAFAGGDIRLYLKNGSPSCLGTGYETRLNNGEIFDPRFVARTGKFGVVRFMNWCMSNGGEIGTAKWADRTQLSSFSWWTFGPPPVTSQWWAGASSGPGTAPNNALTVSQPPGNIASWTQGQRIQFTLTTPPNFFTPSAAVTGNPTIFTATAHGLSNGDQIQFSTDFTSGWRAMTMATSNFSFKFWTVTVIDANTFSIPFDSTGAAAWPTIPCSKVVTLKVGSLAAVPCIQQPWAGPFPYVNSNHGDFGIVHLQAGDLIDGVYDAGLGCVMLSNQGVFFGMPIEVLVSFCNTNGNHPWINIPPGCDDDFVTQLATFLNNNLASGLIPRIEFGNEIWNFPNTGYCAARALTDIGDGSFHSYYAKRTTEISNIFSSVYGGNNGRYKIITAVQEFFNARDPWVNGRFFAFPYTGRAISSISIASPCVVTTTSAHGLSAGQLIAFTTTGALPTGIVNAIDTSKPETVYYVLPTGLGANTFEFSATLGGPAVNTSGSQSGTHQYCIPAIMASDAIAGAPYFATNFDGETNPAINYPNNKAPGGFADQIWNYTQGGALRQTAFAWYANELLSNSQDPTNYPTNQSVSYVDGTLIPFWLNQATLFGKELYDYEGGQGVFPTGTGISLSSGFPGTAPTSGQTVTVANVEAFIIDFYQSQQWANVVTQAFNNSYNLGTRWPSYYTVAQVWQHGFYWGIYQLNAVQNGFVNSAAPLAYTALRAFNDPVLAAYGRTGVCIDF